MTEPSSFFTCGRCGMSFRIEDPSTKCERLRCPDCRMAFWAAKNVGDNTVKVGVMYSEIAA